MLVLHKRFVANMLKRGMADADIRALAECDQQLVEVKTFFVRRPAMYLPILKVKKIEPELGSLTVE